MSPEQELELIMDSIDRFEQMDVAEFDRDEYQSLLRRYEELRRAGYGPQPHHLDD